MLHLEKIMFNLKKIFLLSLFFFIEAPFLYAEPDTNSTGYKAGEFIGKEAANVLDGIGAHKQSIEDAVERHADALGSILNKGMTGLSKQAGQGAGNSVNNLIKPAAEAIAKAAPDMLGTGLKSLRNVLTKEGILFLLQVAPIMIPVMAVTFGTPVFMFYYAPKLAYAYIEKKMFAPTTISYQSEYEASLMFSDFVANTKTKKFLGRYIKMIEYAHNNNFNFPHLLFCGAPGVGKTFVSDIVANEVGIKIVKLNIKSLEGTKAPTDELRRIVEWCKRKKYILMIDECDQVISSRQKHSEQMSEFARGLMTELLKMTGSKQPYFEGFIIFITNTPDSIDDALLSRTLPLEFDYPDSQSVEELLISSIKAGKNDGAEYKISKSYVQKISKQLSKNNQLLADKSKEIGFDLSKIVVTGRELKSMEEFIRLASLGRVIDEKLFDSLKNDFLEILSIKSKYSSDMYTKFADLPKKEVASQKEKTTSKSKVAIPQKTHNPTMFTFESPAAAA